jgi:hypothetical protein
MSDEKITSPLWAKILLAVIQYLPWPIIVFIIVIIFQGPLVEIANSLPNKIKDSNSVRIGSFSLEIKQEAKSQGSPELASALNGLTKESARLLLQLTGSTQLPSQPYISDEETSLQIPGQKEMKGYVLLESKGLITSTNNMKNYKNLLHSLGFTTSNTDFNKNRIDYETYQKLDESEIKNLQNFNVDLTEKGKNAKALILKVVSDLLSKA